MIIPNQTDLIRRITYSVLGGRQRRPRVALMETHIDGNP